MSKLEALGVETAILSFDHQKSSLEVYELSSKGATGFLDSTDTVNNFALHFKGNGYMKIHRNGLRPVIVQIYIIPFYEINCCLLLHL